MHFWYLLLTVLGFVCKQTIKLSVSVSTTVIGDTWFPRSVRVFLIDLIQVVSQLFLSLFSSSPTVTESSQAPMTPPVSFMTCGLTRSSLLTRTPPSCVASPPSPPLYLEDSSWLATMTSTSTSGTHWRQREWVSERCLLNGVTDREEAKTWWRKCGIIMSASA